MRPFSLSSHAAIASGTRADGTTVAGVSPRANVIHPRRRARRPTPTSRAAAARGDYLAVQDPSRCWDVRGAVDGVYPRAPNRCR